MTKQETIDEITRRLVEFYHPLRIYLFGSHARFLGATGPTRLSRATTRVSRTQQARYA